MALIEQNIISDALSAYLDADKKRTVLISSVEKHMVLNPEPNNRNHRVLHPSEVAADNWCPRWNQMLIEDRIPTPPEVLSLRQRSIFAYGHLAHAKWQKWLGEANMLWGQWERPDGTWVWGMRPDAVDGESSVYREVPVAHSIWQGHADGVVLLDRVPHLLEIKTVGTGTIRYGAPHLIDGSDLDKMFSRITQPFSSHMRQVQIYLEILHRMSVDKPDTSSGDWAAWLASPSSPYLAAVAPLDKAVFLYECKSNQDMKEFVAERDVSWVSDRMDAADEMSGYLHSGDLIPCPHDGRCKCRKH